MGPKGDIRTALLEFLQSDPLRIRGKRPTRRNYGRDWLRRRLEKAGGEPLSASLKGKVRPVKGSIRKRGTFAFQLSLLKD